MLSKSFRSIEEGAFIRVMEQGGLSALLHGQQFSFSMSGPDSDLLFQTF